MNSLKTIATATIMAGVLYGVYIFLNRAPNASNSAKTDNLASDGIPAVNITPPTSELGPNGLTEINAEQAFASMPAMVNTGPAPANNNAAGVPVPVSPPVGNQNDPSNHQYDPNSSSPSETSYPDSTAGADNTWQNSMAQVQLELAENRLADAHRDLSRLYFNPDTPPEKKKEIEPRLDQLAGTVVYSQQHLLEKPYKVQSYDTLESIAQRFNVPPGLLVKINGLDPDVPLRPGQEMKVVQGPFSATIDLSDQELTLTTADGRYAGRFRVGVGPYAANVTEESVYMVGNKTDTSSRFDQGQTSLGRRWIGLKDQFGLHGTDHPASIGTSQGNGAISLGDRDIEDLFDILSYGSKVTIRP